jgi:GntR family transcriptional repressor for pyruvate dehydrogenase complex
MTRPSRAPDVVAATLRRRILSGELAPGDSLPTEGELITQLGVSRETVRMALRLLDAEGLTATSQGRSGVRIRHPEPARVARSLVQLFTLTGATWGDLLDFRTMLEPAAAAHVAEHATAPQRKRIAVVAERGIAPDGTGYHEFHELLVQASEQAVRWAAAEQDISQYDRDEAAKSHRAIAAAITAKDPQQAQRRMEQHLKAALRHVEASGLRDAPMIPPSRWRGDNSDLPWR